MKAKTQADVRRDAIEKLMGLVRAEEALEQVASSKNAQFISPEVRRACIIERDLIRGRQAEIIGWFERDLRPT